MPLPTQAYFNSIPASQNPATVAIGATGNTETVYYIQDGLLGIGHVAYSINGSAPIGEYPDSTVNSVELLAPINQQGVAYVGADNLGRNDSNTIVVATTFTISQSAALSLQSSAAALESASVNNTLNYHLWTQSCANFVENANGSAGITTIGGSTPLSLPLPEMPANVFAGITAYELITNNSGTSAPVRFKP